MPGLLGTPTLAKMTVDAVGRLWRRLKKSKKQGPEQGPEQDLHAFYSDSSDSIEYSDSNPDTLECFETIQGWVNGTSDTYDFFGAWRHPSEPSSVGKYERLSKQHETTDNQQVSFDGEVDLFCGVSVRGDLAEPVEAVEPTVPTVPVKPAKRGIKDVFKNVKAAFKQRNTSG
ncbi:hypothetical protein NW755_003224 [Fusarium falciforme]|uniref:Uncharacterized protein n=1 Tax=Fusarium falciforme TaxID=195108 RepID=A0A9W8V2T2_9HYPO|nr:hypothetical protein NW755_003224 [Fusarium falciforme]